MAQGRKWELTASQMGEKIDCWRQREIHSSRMHFIPSQMFCNPFFYYSTWEDLEAQLEEIPLQALANQTLSRIIDVVISSLLASNVTHLFSMYSAHDSAPSRSTVLHPISITRINAGNVRFCKPQTCWSLTFLYVAFSISCCDSAVRMACLGSGMKMTLLRLRKDYILALKTCFGHDKHGWRSNSCQWYKINIQWYHTY